MFIFDRVQYITLTEKYNLVHNLKGIVPRDILIYSAFRTQPRMVTGQNDFEKFCEFAYLHFFYTYSSCQVQRQSKVWAFCWYM